MLEVLGVPIIIYHHCLSNMFCPSFVQPSFCEVIRYYTQRHIWEIAHTVILWSNTLLSTIELYLRHSSHGTGVCSGSVWARTKHGVDHGVLHRTLPLWPSPGPFHGLLWDTFDSEISEKGDNLYLNSGVDLRYRSTSCHFSGSEQQHWVRMEKEDQSNKLRDG